MKPNAPFTVESGPVVTEPLVKPTSPLTVDNGGLSPLAQALNTLQQLQQTNPAEYRQVTQQIATNLQTAAKTAQSDGNTPLANQLNQSAGDFTTASRSGQPPNLQDLAQAAGARHGHRHNGGHAANSSHGGVSATNPFLAAVQAGAGQNSSLNPTDIILNTVTSAGISSSNG